MMTPAMVSMTKAMTKGNVFCEVAGGEGDGEGDGVTTVGVAAGVESPVPPAPPVPQLLTGVSVAVGRGTVGVTSVCPGVGVVLLVTGERGLFTVKDLLSSARAKSSITIIRRATTGRKRICVLPILIKLL